jgi:PEP-CTERM motif
MQQHNGLRTSMAAVAFLALCLGLSQRGNADTVTDTSLDVSYTATSTFVPVTDNTFDVFLTIDPTAFDAGTGFLTAFSLAFKTGSDVSTAVSLVSAPGGVSDWSTEIPGGLDSSGCNGKGASSGDVCFQNLGSAGTSVPGGPYKFELAVTLPDSDALTAASDIKAAYNTLQNNDGKNLGLTSMGITIQKTATPEPSSLLFMLAGGLLVGLIASRKRRLNPRS